MSSVRLLSLVVLLLSLAVDGAAANSPEPLSDSVLRLAAARSYANAELADYDGTDAAKPILMGVRGIVFDVSSGSRFYGPDAMYHVLVGRDATRAVARMSLDPADLNDRCDGLADKDWALLERVLRDTYLAKYPVVGHVKGGYFYPDGLCCAEAGCGGC